MGVCVFVSEVCEAQKRPFVDSSVNVLSLLSGQSDDRSRILVAHSLLDEMLGQILWEAFELYGGTSKDSQKVFGELLVDSAISPIGAFAVRNKVCFALGRISKETYNALRCLNKIRVSQKCV